MCLYAVSDNLPKLSFGTDEYAVNLTKTKTNIGQQMTFKSEPGKQIKSSALLCDVAAILWCNIKDGSV